MGAFPQIAFAELAGRRSREHCRRVFSRQILPSAVRATAQTAGGLVRSDDLTNAGVTRDGIASLVGREMTRIASGLFIVGREPTWQQYADAALHIAGDGAFLFRRTAFAVHPVRP